MKTIRQASTFKKDYRRTKSHPVYRRDIDSLLDEVRNCFIAGKPLPPRFKDHRLKGNLSDCRECHLKYDLLLVYRPLAGGDIIELLQLGSHSEIFNK